MRFLSIVKSAEAPGSRLTSRSKGIAWLTSLLVVSGWAPGWSPGSPYTTSEGPRNRHGRPPPPLVLRQLRPPDAWCGRLGGQHLPRARSRNVGDVLHTAPLGGDHEQCSIAGASEHAGETAAIKLDCLQHLTPFVDAHATLVGNISVPDGFVGVDADPVGNASAEVGPHPLVRQAAVRSDVEGGEPFSMGVGDDQRCVVGRHGHAIGKGDAIGYLRSEEHTSELQSRLHLVCRLLLEKKKKKTTRKTTTRLWRKQSTTH